jgi:serine/threonine protein kinase/Flp pilus assembly protein TadD
MPSPGRHDQLKDALARHDELPPPERAAFLAALRESEPDLARDLDTLLAHPTRPELAAGASGLVVEALAGSAPLSPGSAIGKRIGPYQILELLGTGGMGVVYRAAQETPIRRDVAIKILRGGFNPDQILARFEGERRALALADHPGIARILDAGSDEHGAPYLVMELVRGVPITDYARARALSVRARVALLASACRAVQHAHQKGIIHRDLKPSNVLVSEVDGVATVKVIDFGIARLIDESERPHGTLTGEGQVLGTLEYMSPEQAQGRVREIDTRSDVYALGAVLYELLTGDRPHDLVGKSLPEAVEIIANERPRAFGRTRGGRTRVDSDLETIAMKALEHEPARRYEGAGALADDLERYLRAEPIAARPPSTAYQIRKLAQRHRTAVAVGSSLVLLLSVFGVTMTFLFAAQSRERERAENEAGKAEAINRFLQEMLAAAQPELLGKDVTVRQVVESAIPRVDRELAGEPRVRAAVQRTLANTLIDLGDASRAESLFRASIALQRADPRGPTPELAATLREYSGCLETMNRYTDAIPIGREALALSERLHGLESDETVTALQALGVALAYHDIAESESLFARAATITKKTHGEDSPEYADAVFALARGASGRGDFVLASDLLRVAATIYSREYGEGDPRTIDPLADLAFALAYQADHFEEAVALTRRVLDAKTKLYGPTHQLTVVECRNLGILLHKRGDFAEAESLMLWALRYEEERGFTTELRWTYRYLGALYHSMGRLEEAKRWYLRLQDPKKRDPKRAGTGMMFVDEGRIADALASTRDGLARAMKAGDTGHGGPRLGWVMYQHGNSLLADGQLDSAGYWLSRSLQEFGEVSRPYMQYWIVESAYGVYLDRTGRRAEADSAFARSVGPLVKFPNMEPVRRAALIRLARHFRWRGEPDQVARIEQALAAMPKLPQQLAAARSPSGRGSF